MTHILKARASLNALTCDTGPRTQRDTSQVNERSPEFRFFFFSLSWAGTGMTGRAQKAKSRDKRQSEIKTEEKRQDTNKLRMRLS